LYDEIAIHLARAFYETELPFVFCDWILNDIHGLITTNDALRPDLFWKIFLALDEGEYYHAGKRDEDPVEVYKRPYDCRNSGGLLTLKHRL
jgi:hypothetical protein